MTDAAAVTETGATRLTVVVRLTLAEAVRDDGGSSAAIRRAAQEQARKVTDAINAIAYVESESLQDDRD